MTHLTVIILKIIPSDVVYLNIKLQLRFKKHYLDNFNYDKTKENELNEDEFVKFWADLYALFEKIDKDGDGEIAVVECVSLLDDKAEKFGLTKGGLLQLTLWRHQSQVIIFSLRFVQTSRSFLQYGRYRRR